jgi:hypothetical protein
MPDMNDAPVNDWKQVPMGFAVVDQTDLGHIAVHHVSFRFDSNPGLDPFPFTGFWIIDAPNSTRLRDLITQRILVGTRDGIDSTQSILNENLISADLAALVAACESAEIEYQRMWQDHQDFDPIKRKNLVPLNAKTWPSIGDDGDAAEILKRIDLKPYPESSPPETRDALALSKLIHFILTTWYELESERLARPYLSVENKERALLPPAWLASHPPYWPATK